MNARESGMLEQDREPVAAICLLAALADGERTAEEQAQLARIAARLSGGEAGALPERVERGEISAAEAARRLSSAEARRLAYEMAVSVVYADGDANAREQEFLSGLRREMNLPDDGLAAVHQDARALATAPIAGPIPAVGDPPSGPRPSQAGIPAMSHDAALDLMIRQQALLAGALELLPQGLASMAIIPVQLRLVYRIGADYGHKPDADQIKDLLGVMGVGAAAQVLDGVARRILSGLGHGMFGRVLGGLVGGAAGVAAGAGLAFVTTYALGHAAEQYYAQGRRLSREDLRALFERFKAQAEATLPEVQEELHAQAQHLDLGRLLKSLRGELAT
jgi:uncharacterized protein (DUF697 family)/uncharacterized tellurite resistance protein B-like protein